MLTKPVDDILDASEWRDFLRVNNFGQVVAPGRDLALPVVTPLHFALVGVGRRHQQTPAEAGHNGDQGQAPEYAFAAFYRLRRPPHD